MLDYRQNNLCRLDGMTISLCVRARACSVYAPSVSWSVERKVVQSALLRVSMVADMCSAETAYVVASGDCVSWVSERVVVRSSVLKLGVSGPVAMVYLGL